MKDFLKYFNFLIKNNHKRFLNININYYYRNIHHF